jgi:ribosomal protein S18 acetylase RimI-like enzyme
MNSRTAISITRRSAREDDVPFLLQLRVQAMEPHQLLAGICHSPAEREARVRAHFECAQVIEMAGRPIGLLKLLRASDEWRVVQLQLLPEHQGAGIGSHLLGILVAQARDAGVPLTLSVLKANPARRLYERLGFEVTSEGERVFHMQATG